MNQDCWVLKEGEGPRPNPGDIACWLQNVPQSPESSVEDGCPEGKTCYEVPDGLRGPQPGDTLCWPGKGKEGPNTSTKAVWEAKRDPGEPSKITWEGRTAGIEEIFNVYSPKAAGNNRVLPSKSGAVSPNAGVGSFRPGKANEDVKASSEIPESKPQLQMPQAQPYLFAAYPQMEPCSLLPYRPNSFTPNLLCQSASTPSTSSSSASSSYGKFRFNNAFFCNCNIPLPPWLKQKKRKKQSSKKPAPPLCAVTCGNAKCAASKFTTQEYKCIPISKGYYDDPKPGICCYLYGQTVFNTSDKKNKTEDSNFNFAHHHSCTTYSISTSRHHPFRQPQQVQLIKPVAKPTVDNDNDSFLLNLSKKDHCGNPAKLHLSFKIPKTKLTYRYDAESQFPENGPRKPKTAGTTKGKKGGKGKKGKKGKKGGSKKKKGKSAGKKKKK